jgi:hypothetical protein
MSERKPIRDGAELFQSINRTSAEAEWTAEELRRELREGGIDPDQLVKSAREKLEELRGGSAGRAASAQVSDVTAGQSTLAELRSHTGAPASRIAREMDVPVAFLSAVGRYPNVVPMSWRRELADRAERKLKVPSPVVMNSFEHPYQEQMAALRDGAYEAEDVTYENILDQAGMTGEARQFWLSLAAEG